MKKYTIFWFRRDLRLEDNTALRKALQNSTNVIPIFIFDENIINELPVDDPRISFIYNSLNNIDVELKKINSSLLCLKGDPFIIWKNLINEYPIERVFINNDYEPYAIKRDLKIKELLEQNGIEFFSYKDQVIFEELEVVKNDGTPYTVYTPYKNKWLSLFNPIDDIAKNQYNNLYQGRFEFPSLDKFGFTTSKILVKDFSLSNIDKYSKSRDFPYADIGTYLGSHLRFGTISIRQIIDRLNDNDKIFVNELIWREFFMQIIYNFPHVVDHNFRSKYDGIQWRNNETEFEKWCTGQTGYPMVDAGMRELNQTGYMHNRVRMITAGFLCKHLLIDWRWGEAYFAEKLFDYELSSNNGNWQWAAGTGCDAAPYFRIFNPEEQLRKFDKEMNYVKKWIPEYETNNYPKPIVDHKFARIRALETYKNGII